MKIILRPVGIIILATIIVLGTASVAAAHGGVSGYGPGGRGNGGSSGSNNTPPSGCGNNCPAPLPNPPSCSFGSMGVMTGWLPSGAPATVYVVQCSPACTQSGGSVQCSPPSPPCSNAVGTPNPSGNIPGTTAACPVGGTTTSWGAQYGYSASPGNVCVSKWLVTYAGQSYSTVPAGCSASLSMPANYFRQSCTNAPTTATVQYWLQLPTISPPSGWTPSPPFPPNTSTSGGGASYPDGSGALLGPYTQTVTVPPCPVYQGIKYGNYVLTQLNDGNGIAGGQPVVVGTNPHGATVENGLWLAADGSVHHYIFGFKIQLPPNVSSVGVDPYLQWIKGTASVASRPYYDHKHDMFGTWLPAWNLHFSSLTAGDGGCPSGMGHPYCNTPGPTSYDPNSSPWYLVSQWAYWPINAPYTAAKDNGYPKIVVDFEMHEPTVEGKPLQLQLNGEMEAGWFYNHFSVNASVSGTQGTTTFTGKQPQTETINKTAPSKSKSTCAENHATMRNGWCTITTTSTQIIWEHQTFNFVYPATVSATVSTTQLSPTQKVTSSPFPVQATADIQARGAFLAGSS